MHAANTMPSKLSWYRREGCGWGRAGTDAVGRRRAFIVVVNIYHELPRPKQYCVWLVLYKQ